MAIGLTERNAIVLETLQGTKQIEKFVTDEDLKADDLEGMINRLQKVADKLNSVKELEIFLTTEQGLKSMGLPLTDDFKDRGKKLASIFTEDSRLDTYRKSIGKGTGKRKVKKLNYTIGDHTGEMSLVGALSKKIKGYIDEYNKENNTNLTKGDLTNTDTQRDDFKAVEQE